MNERHDSLEIGIRKILRRHTFVGTAIAYDRCDLVATIVLGDKDRARQVGAGLSAHRVTPVAESAGCGEQRLSSLHEFRCIRLRCESLRRPLRRRTLLCRASSTLTAASARRSGGLRCLSAEDDGEEKAKEQGCAHARSHTNR